jgi:general secretion pathway protein D
MIKSPYNLLPLLLVSTGLLGAKLYAVELEPVKRPDYVKAPSSAPPKQPSPPIQPPGAIPVPGTPKPDKSRPVVSRPQPAGTPVKPDKTVAEKPAPMRKGEVLLNFQAADIQAVVKAVSQMTGRNFLLDPRVKGKITIISATPVSQSDAYQIFASALKAQGFTVVDGAGGIINIIPVGEAKQHGDVSLQTPRGGDLIRTHVIVVQHGSPTQMIPLLRPLMAPTSQLSAYEPANALIITDYAENIRRLLRIIEAIDQPVSSDVTVIPLEHASALDLAELITRLGAPGQAQPGKPGAQAGIAEGRFTILPDLRTNSLLIQTDNPGRLSQLRSLIGKLDVPAKPGGNVRVVYLRNAESTKVAEVLRGLLAGEARTAAAPAVKGGVQASPASLVQADEATNSLIISASDAIYNNLRAVIERLDIRRAQVFVEALIAEITSDNAAEFGFQWFGGNDHSRGTLGAVINFTSGTSIVNTAATRGANLAGSGGLTLALLGEKITLPDGSTVTSLGGLARALEQSNIGNILSTPNIMTLDNAEAKIVVGENVPFVTGSFAQATGTTGAAVNPFQTIERKDVGLTLKIKPQISEGGTIIMDIFQEASSVGRAVEAASDLVTNKRTLETKVVVDDGHTIVLGGLIQDSLEETEERVPVLGRIPLLGALFRYRTKTNKKTTLLVFLRPVIVRTPEDGYNVTTDRYYYMRAQDQDKVKERADMLDRFIPTKPDGEVVNTRAAYSDDPLGPPNATSEGQPPDNELEP